MSNTRATEAWRKYAKPGGLLDYGPDLSRLLVRLQRELAQGRPVPEERVGRIVADMNIDREGAYRLLGEVDERDTDNNVVGIILGA
jgi:hypothetical protein